MGKATRIIGFMPLLLALACNSYAQDHASEPDVVGVNQFSHSIEEDRELIHHSHDHESLKETASQRSPRITRPRIQSRAARTGATACDDDAFASTGQDLIDAITTQNEECIGRLFFDASAAVLAATFTEANLITVAQEAEARSIIYDGTDSNGALGNLYYWLRAVFYYDSERFRQTPTQLPVRDAIRALAENAHFYDLTAENAYVVNHAAVDIQNASIGEYFVDVTKELLSRYDESYQNTANWGSALTNLFWLPLDSCARIASCRAVEHDAALVKLIGDFIYDNIGWLDTPDADYHLFNTSYQLAALYEGSNDTGFAALLPELEFQLNRIFAEFGPYQGDLGRLSYITALQSLNYHGSCDDYGLCDKRQEVLDTVLNNRMTCPSGTLFMWAQDMNAAEMQWVCDTLAPQENYFHEKQQTNRVAVVPDDNDLLRMIIFDDSKEWQTYGGFLFDAGTDNGGLYLEGDPAVAGDQATFFAYEDVTTRPIFGVWNLHHEYIHYLDGRYIEKGGFTDVLDPGRTVWYLEGTAEYISRRDCNAAAISEARQGTYALSTIFQNSYSSGQTRVYRWGYLANRFMYERHSTEYFEMLELFKQGRYQEYRDNLVDVWVDNQTFDAEFSDWLTTVESTGCVVDTTRPISPQGDQVGVDACAVSSGDDSPFSLTIGEAVCLPTVTNGDEVSKAVHIDDDLAGYALEITLRHGSGNTRLSQAHDNYPTDTFFDTREEGAGTEKTLNVNYVNAGWNYISIEGEQDFSGVTLLAQIKNSDSSVTLAPIATINGPYFQTTGLSLDFSSAGSRDNDGIITNFHWEFGDGQSSDEANPAHTYATAGTYITTLRVTDDDGLETTASTTVTITDTIIAGNACDTQSPVEPSLLELGQLYCLVSTGIGGQLQMEMWIGEPLVGKRLEIKLANGSGNANLYYRHNFRPSQTTFDQISANSGNDEIIILESALAGWSYIHVIASPEFSGVTLSSRELGSDPPPVAPVANINGPYSAISGNGVAFSSAGSSDSDGSISGYFWEFGDGQTSTTANPTHVYATAGDYVASLRVTDDDGLETTATTTVTISAPPPVAPVANINGPYSAISGNGVAFSSAGSSDSDGSISGYFWEFGDGQTSTTANPTHVYATAGDYVASLRVTDDDGLETTATTTVTISDPGVVLVAPFANIYGTYVETTGNSLTFSSAGSGDSDGIITLYNWDFGDGQFSSNANPTHTYTNAGVYTVTLRVTDNNGLEASDATEVTINDPFAPDDICATQPPVEVSQVSLNTSYCLVDRNGGDQLRMSLYVGSEAAGKRLEIKLAHGSGNANLLVQLDSGAVTTSTNSGNDEVIVIESARLGWHYIHVVAAFEFTGVSLSSRVVNNGSGSNSASSSANSSGPQSLTSGGSGAGSAGFGMIIVLSALRRFRIVSRPVK